MEKDGMEEAKNIMELTINIRWRIFKWKKEWKRKGI